MKLTLDGKTIGEFDGTTIRPLNDGDDKSVKRETITVPVFARPNGEEDDGNEDDDAGERDDNTTEDEDEETDETEQYLKKLDPKSRMFVESILADNTSLSKKLDRFARKLDSITTRPPADNDEDDDEIGDIPADKDPFGVARTLRKVAQRMKMIDAKVNRLDQHTGYKEIQGNLEAAKATHKVFKNPSTRIVAEKLLEAELKTNRIDSVEEIVASVAKDVRKLGLSSAKSYVKEKVGTAGKIPGVIRTGDGASPAITVERPKNVKEAGNAYKAWRTQNAKMNRR